jgi:hypothetical protein
MPDGHHPATPQATAIDDQFGTHSLKARLRPMRSLKRLRSARVISAGHAFVQISVEATTNSAQTSIDGIGSQRSSQNSSAPSDQDSTAG